MRTLCLPPALCRFRSGPSRRWGCCWRRSPTSPLCGAIRIGWRSIRPCLPPGLRGRALRSFCRWACFWRQARDARASSARSRRQRSARPPCSGRRLSPCCPRACERRSWRPSRRLQTPRAQSQGLLWAPVRAAAGDPQAILVWTAFGAAVFALACVAFRRALRARCDRLCGRAGLCRRRSEGDGALWRERQHGLAHQGAARRLARPLADVATSSAGRLYDAARRHSLARRRPDGHGRGRLHAGARGDRRPTRRRALLDRALGRGRAGFPRHRSLSPRRQSNAPRSRRLASRSRSFSPCPLPPWPSLRPGLGFARFCSAPARSPRPRWSISGDRRHRVAASCCAVIRSRSSSA